MLHRHHVEPSTVMLEHALDGLGASPSGLAHALGAWIVRRFGPVKAGQFADTVVKAVQIEIRKGQREAPFVEVRDDHAPLAQEVDDLHDAALRVVSGFAAGIAAAALVALLSFMGWSIVDATSSSLDRQIAAGAAEW